MPGIAPGNVIILNLSFPPSTATRHLKVKRPDSSFFLSSCDASSSSASLLLPLSCELSRIFELSPLRGGIAGMIFFLFAFLETCGRGLGGDGKKILRIYIPNGRRMIYLLFCSIGKAEGDDVGGGVFAQFVICGSID